MFLGLKQLMDTTLPAKRFLILCEILGGFNSLPEVEIDEAVPFEGVDVKDRKCARILPGPSNYFAVNKGVTVALYVFEISPTV